MAEAQLTPADHALVMEVARAAHEAAADAADRLRGGNGHVVLGLARAAGLIAAYTPGFDAADDPVGRRLGSALAEAASEGVQHRALGRAVRLAGHRGPWGRA